MKQRKTKTYIIDGKKYRFNHSDFKKLYLFKLSQDKSLEQVKSEQEFRENMASAICTSVEAIKKWRYGINSPGDTEIISDIEKYFHVKQGRLLIEEAPAFKTEDKVLSSRMITDYERNAVRTLYQGLVACIIRSKYYSLTVNKVRIVRI